MTNKRTITKRLSIWAVIVTCIMLIPLVAKWPWTGSDYILGAIILFGCACLYEFATIHMKQKNKKIVTAIAVVIIVVFIWAELAVGLIGTPFAGN